MGIFDVIGVTVIVALIYLGGRWVINNVEFKKKD